MRKGREDKEKGRESVSVCLIIKRMLTIECNPSAAAGLGPRSVHGGRFR